MLHYPLSSVKAKTYLPSEKLTELEFLKIIRQNINPLFLGSVNHSISRLGVYKISQTRSYKISQLYKPAAVGSTSVRVSANGEFGMEKKWP